MGVLASTLFLDYFLVRVLGSESPIASRIVDPTSGRDHHIAVLGGLVIPIRINACSCFALLVVLATLGLRKTIC